MNEHLKIRRGYTLLAGLVATLAVGVYVERYHLLYGKDVRDTYQFFDTLVDLRTQILHNYVEKVDEQKLLNGAINGMMGELDPYSNYFTKDEFTAFSTQTQGQYSGIGAEMSQDQQTGQFLIITPLDDSPALKAGILAGDRLLKVNDESLEGLTLKDLTSRISGVPDTDVKLTVVHEGEKTPVDLTVRRGVVQMHSVKGYRRDDAGGAAVAWDYLLDAERRIAYVRITSFTDSTATDLDAALLPLINSKAGLKGIILDLRFNPGGLLKTGVEVADRFLDSGVIVSVRKPEGKDHETFSAHAEGTYPKIPLVVLINEYSASAAEIVAGALKDHDRAVLIGMRSFGKGSVQNLITLDNGNAALKLTTHYYYLPSGRNIARKKNATTWGVEPDPVFQIPMTDVEKSAVLMGRARSEILKIKKNGTTSTAPSPTTSATTSAPATTTSRPTEIVDRQLQRALEILVAQYVFSGERPRADVSTTRPEATAAIGTQPETSSQPAPAPPAPKDVAPSQPASKPATTPATVPAPASAPASKPAPTEPTPTKPVETKPSPDAPE